MPIPGGTQGAHNDDSHQGSAKRDVVNGVAGLDASGHLLGLGHQIQFPRSGGDIMQIIDRTSSEYPIHFQRAGLNDWSGWIQDGGLSKEILHAGRIDAVDGVAGIDASGMLLVPAHRMYLTRGGSEQVSIWDRTSVERIVRWIRDAANSYTGYITRNNIEREILTDELHCVEEYTNHEGTNDFFTELPVGGNGTAVHNAADHGMDLSGGATVQGHGGYMSKKTFTMGARPAVCSFVIQDIVDGTASKFESFYGLKTDFTSDLYLNQAAFVHNYLGQWRAISADGANDEETSISPVSAGDVLTVVATSSSVRYYVNGALVATHGTYIPAAAMHLGGSIVAYAAGAGVARTTMVDFMSIKQYM